VGLGPEWDATISLVGGDLRIWERGEPGFEEACCATVANARRPVARPDCVAAAKSPDDVQAAVSLAGQRGWRLAVCSGGHSWSGAHLRGDGMLLDVSALQTVSVDVERRVAQVGPGVRSSSLQRVLARDGLFFPTGHCTGPCVGGYLLQGGFGWHSRVLGPGCVSVLGVDVVTADGSLVRADAESNSELYWAARGAGPGFFGVVVNFELQLHVRPPAMVASAYLYPVELLDEVMRWAHTVSPDVPESIELLVFLRRDMLGHAGPGLQVLAPALAESEEAARSDLEFVADCSLRDRALVAQEFTPTDVIDLVVGSDDFYPSGYRYAADNMWTSAPVDDLLDGYRRIAETLPASPTHMMWMNWRPPLERPDMAFSLEDDVYIALYSVWQDEADDPQFVDWPSNRMRELEGVASGIQLADENLARRPMPFMAPDNLRRLEELRARFDPDGRFHGWPGAS
jgi:FAD/FMN-containing dehydrogenase